jgi:hypothetical protein
MPGIPLAGFDLWNTALDATEIEQIAAEWPVDE